MNYFVPPPKTSEHWIHCFIWRRTR